MAIPNINQITSTLRMMGDSALQQYATMHKNDPYILPMAIAESNARKQMRSQAQAKMAMQPQPKVAEKEIAEMSAPTQLPEQQGIAQLPAPNIQSMAGGGIVAFADGGYAGGGMGASEPVIRMSGGGEIKKYSGQAESLVRTTDGGQSWWLDIPAASRGKPAVAASLANKKFTSRQEALDAYNALAGGDMSTAPAAPTSAPLIIPYGQSKATNVLGDKPPAPPAPPPAPPMQQSLGSIPSTKVLTPEQAKAQANEFVDFSESRTALKQAESDQETQGARMRTMLSEGLPKTPALQGLEKLLDKQDAETGGEKDKAAGLALLMGGLAIAGGSSQFALQNLKEAMPAVAQYGDALKDIKKMERENMKMRGEIEQARRAENRDNTKLKLELEDKILGRKDTINKLGIDLTAKIAGTTAEVASKVWSTSYDAANREKVAGLAAIAGSNAELNKYAQLGAADPNSALAKGFQMYKQEGAEPKLYSEYIKLSRDPIDGEAFRQRFPSFEIFKEGYTGGGGVKFAAPPASASILKPPKG